MSYHQKLLFFKCISQHSNVSRKATDLQSKHEEYLKIFDRVFNFVRINIEINIRNKGENPQNSVEQCCPRPSLVSFNDLDCLHFILQPKTLHMFSHFT